MTFDAAMRALLVIVSLVFGSQALAAEQCERQALVNAFGKLDNSKVLRVDKDATKVTVTDVITKDVVLEATCDGLKLPLAQNLERKTIKNARYSVSRTARGAVSLSIESGLVAADGIEVVAFDDDSVHLTDSRGRLWYTFVTKPDGTLVETEGGFNGCGCERTTSPSGQQVTRKL